MLVLANCFPYTLERTTTMADLVQTEQLPTLDKEGYDALAADLTELEKAMVADGRLTLEQLGQANDFVETIPTKSRKKRAGGSIYDTILSCMAEGSPTNPVPKAKIQRLLVAVHGAYYQRGKQKRQPRTFDNYFTPSALDQGKEPKDRLWIKAFTVMGSETRGFWLKEVYEARNRMEHSAGE